MIRTLRTYFNYSTLLSFVLSGLIINCLQFINYLLVKPFSVNLYRTINHNLLFSLWSQTTAPADWNTNLKCRLYFSDQETYKEFGNSMGLVLANHRYDIDWLCSWKLCEFLGSLGQDKAVMKSELKYVPIFGWCCSVSDMMFLSRNWEKDRKNVIAAMDVLLTYSKSYLVAFAEGTRFTPAKHEAAIKFAEEKNLSFRPRHHLLPRTRGFTAMIQRAKEVMKKDPTVDYCLYNMQISLDDEDIKSSSLTSLLSGAENCAHIYISKVDIKNISIEKEEEATEVLYNIWKEKDVLADYFKKNRRFPGIQKPYKRRVTSLLNWLAWWFVTYATLIYQYYKCLASGNLIYILSLTSLGIAAIFAVTMLLNTTKVSKSSKYGINAPDKKE